MRLVSIEESLHLINWKILVESGMEMVARGLKSTSNHRLQKGRLRPSWVLAVKEQIMGSEFLRVKKVRNALLVKYTMMLL